MIIREASKLRISLYSAFFSHYMTIKFWIYWTDDTEAHDAVDYMIFAALLWWISTPYSSKVSQTISNTKKG